MRLPENTFWLLIGIVVIMLLMIPILEINKEKDNKIKEKDNKINMLEKEVKTIQGQYQNSLIRIKELRDDKS